jgi:hypothetical protein
VDIGDIRRANLKTLIRDHAEGNVRKFVELAGLESHTAILHVTGLRPTRNLGPQLARKIERNLQLGAGWMDRDRSNSAAGATPSDGGRTERALKYYASIEKLPEAVRKTIDELIVLFEAGQKKTKRKKKKSESPKR